MKLAKTYQTLPKAFYTAVDIEAVPQPELLLFNESLAAQLGFDASLTPATLAQWFSGQNLPPETQPIAQAYAGHQFGQLNILGDGRAVLLSEVELTDEALIAHYKSQYIDIQLKGCGRTAFSRGGDGKAAIAAMLREYLISEAMFALNIPSTRSLAVVTTGETVYRKGPRKGAVLTRTAASHLRVGTFVYASMLAQQQDDITPLTDLINYAVDRHYPDCKNAENAALALLQAVMDAQLSLLAHWMRVGFIHGVLNTDNVTISGETIDYGPCAFMDVYDPATVFSSIDHAGRYAFANQAPITQWNMARFAESLLPAIDSDAEKAIALASELINSFEEKYEKARVTMMSQKLGISETILADNDEAIYHLVEDLLSLMLARKMDYTNTFIALTLKVMGESNTALTTLPSLPEDEDFIDWLARWEAMLAIGINANLATDLVANSIAMMQQHNPIVIPRNHQVEQALQSAEQGDLSVFNDLLNVVQLPYDWRNISSVEAYQQPATNDWLEKYQTFCGT